MENEYCSEKYENIKDPKKNEILENAYKMQNIFYTNSQKNFFFKKKQKLECAKVISENTNLDHLIHSTFFIIPNKNIIFFDYTIFKIYGNNDNYLKIVDYVLYLVNHCIQQYGNYEIHISLNTFSISALERYKPIIEMFSQKAIHCNLISKFCIYYSPSFIDTILRVLGSIIKEDILAKTIFYKKEDSDALIKHILQ